jgi:hypothetical protein
VVVDVTVDDSAAVRRGGSGVPRCTGADPSTDAAAHPGVYPGRGGLPRPLCADGSPCDPFSGNGVPRWDNRTRDAVFFLLQHLENLSPSDRSIIALHFSFMTSSVEGDRELDPVAGVFDAIEDLVLAIHADRGDPDAADSPPAVGG